MSGVTTESEEPSAFLGSLGKASENPWTVTLQLDNSPVIFCIDTGAEVTVISDKTWRNLGKPTLTSPEREMRGPDNHRLVVLGQWNGTLQYSSTQTKETIYVVEGLSKPLVGRPAIKNLQLVTGVSTVSKTLSPQDQFPSLFKGLEQLEGDNTIRLREGAKPFALSAPRRIAVPVMKVKDELSNMEKLGVIKRVSEPTDWCAGVVVVPKPDGRVRICVDLTKLNENVLRERHQLPAVGQTLAQLAGGKVFSKLDANSGFWQIPLSPESANLTTFITPFGRFCFQRLPFGISSAPEHFQRRMQEILVDIPGVVCQMDDILVCGKSQEEHDSSLEMVLNRLQKAGLTLNREKCQFSRTSVKFLGHIIDQTGIRPDPDKISAIQKIKPPTCVSDVRRFLGLVNQMSKFIPNLAEITKPLRELLVKSNQWTWDRMQQSSFEAIKDRLTHSPVLAMFDPNLETVVAADASSFGLGAVLQQKQPDGEMKPVSYISRSMTATEQRYAQIEKEALAFTWACERLSDYLLGLKFHIQTDHKPLVPLFSTKNLEELPVRVQRFRLRMMRFEYTISHVRGTGLVIADTLSRAPAPENGPTSDLLQETEA